VKRWPGRYQITRYENKNPASGGVLSLILLGSNFALFYRLGLEPGPVGASVDPLGEAFGASVFPEGFAVLPGLADEPFPIPVVPEVPVPVVPLVVDGLLLMPVPAE
jgi:hypothetical protein